ncbi:HugZ family protein [Lichenicoccus sp.]|uniref:HugZ family pyridoxamine 5'-phosphate oxidase n=1 Tax=Lichenicoccus sp. TaxID=2781899 RepID=UPI003D0D1B3B
MADDVAWQARKLLRAARSATLATARDGQPFASLVTPACAADLSMLMLLSSLSEHTAHLLAEPRCAILVTGTPADLNPQTAPRLSVVGRATPDPDPELRARWVALHPYAAFYAGLGDFRIFRLHMERCHFIGGFASAHRLRPADIAPDAAAVGAVAEMETSIIAGTDAAMLARIAGGPEWRMASVDVDGCDLVRGEMVRRIAFSAPVADAGGVAAELRRLSAAAARAARCG